MPSLPANEPVEHVAVGQGVEIAVHRWPDPLAASRSGTDAPPPLLLVHATGFCARLWDPVVAHLADRWRCLAPDARAHGLTVTPPGADLSWTAVAHDLVAVVDRLGLRGVAAAGHSMGGAVLLLAEAASPGTFSSLYCYEPVTYPPELGARFLVLDELPSMTLRRRDRFGSREEARANFASKPPMNVFDPDALDAYVAHCFVGDDAGVRLRTPPATEAALYRFGATHGTFERLGGVRCPVTIAAGVPEGDLLPSVWADRVAAALPHGRLERFDDLGHFGPQQAPARIAASITAALTPASAPTAVEPARR